MAYSDARTADYNLMVSLGGLSICPAASPSAGSTPTPADVPLIVRATTRSPFLALPAEIRNEVYDLVLVQSRNHSIDAEDSFPVLTRVCTQIRAETLLFWFNEHEFVARVKDGNYTSFAKWLAIFGGLGYRRKGDYLFLIVICTVRLINGKIYHRCPKHDNEPRLHWSPNFEHWNDLMLKIKEAGLVADGLVFEFGISHNDFHAWSKSSLIGNRKHRRIEEEYPFFRFVLPPLLRIHKLYDIEELDLEYHTENVIKLLIEDEMRWDGNTSRVIRKVEKLVMQAAMDCKLPPELCFEHWALRGADTKASKAMVKEECKRLLEERLEAKDDVADGWHVGLQAYAQRASEVLGSSQLGCQECEMERKGRLVEHAELGIKQEA